MGLDPGGLPDQPLAESQRLVLHQPRIHTAAGRGEELPEDEPTGREIPPVGAIGGMIPDEPPPGLQGLLAPKRLGRVCRPNLTPTDTNYPISPSASRLTTSLDSPGRSDPIRGDLGTVDPITPTASADTRCRPRSTHRRR